MLKGIGAAIGLPFLDAMTPAFAASSVPGGSPVRAAWFYVPNGIDMRHWTPGDEGAGRLPVFWRHADEEDLLVLGALGEQAIMGAVAAYMTGIAGIRQPALGVSADQLMARQWVIRPGCQTDRRLESRLTG